MAEDISGFGFRVNVAASKTFPQGVIVTQFADDADPFDTPAIKVADKTMGLNGDLIVWSKATPIDVTIAVVPDSEDDKNLAVLLEANRVGKGKQSARDSVSLTGIYPAGNSITLSDGKITDGPVASSIASAGRMKSKVYTFSFGNRAGGAA